MYLVTLDGLTASHSSHEQYTDPAGVEWVCTSLEGWARAPGRRTQHTARDTDDGAHRSAAYRDTRSYTVAGRFFVPSGPALGDELEERVLAMLSDPGRRYPLTVARRHGRALTAYVEQAAEILCEQTGPRWWDWSVPVVASDPYRYAGAWTSTSSGPASAGSGGISFGGSGASFAAPGLGMGTVAAFADVVAVGEGTQDTAMVWQLDGQTSGVTIEDLAGGADIGVVGEVPAGTSMFINPSTRTAFDVPGAPFPIPPRQAVMGGASARGALRVPNGWPVLPAGAVRTYRLSGSTGPGSGLTVHTRGTWV